MKHRLKEPFGKAGLTVAILALVMAMVGGAFAANYGASASKAGKQGKQGKPGKTGKTGPAGPAGPAGAKGDPGAAGANGTNGTNGTNGVSVTTSAASNAECPSGGIKVSSASPATKVCNGTTGFTETLPSGKTETGTITTPLLQVEAGAESMQVIATPISFAIPLGAPLGAAEVHFVSTEEQEEGTGPAECPGSAESPLAQAGNLCVYQGGTLIQEANGEGEEEARVVKIFPVTATTAGDSGAATSGADALVLFEAGEGLAFMQASWAVTAP